MAMLDLSGIERSELEEIHRQGEACLQGTLQLALAADQRATIMSGIFGAGAVALLGAAAGVLGSATPLTNATPLLVALLSAAAIWIVGMVLCALAAQPVKFHVAGYEPKKLAGYAADRTEILRYASEDLQDRINHNRDALDDAGRYFKRGTRVGFAGPVVGVVAYLFSLCLLG